MSNVAIYAFFSSLVFSLFSFASQRPVKIFNPGLVQSALTVESFSTDTNYDSNGQGVPLSAVGSNFVATTIDFSSRYVMGTNWGIFANLDIAGSESNNGTDTRSNSGLSHVDFGTDYLLMKGYVDLVLEADIRLPFYKVDTTTDSSLISEGDTHFQTLLQLQKKSRRYYGYLWGGFNYRDGDRSSLLPFGVGGQLQLSRWSLGAEVEGFTSLIEDGKANSPSDRSAVTDRVNAGSLRYYSVNPSLLIVEGNIKYKLSRVTILNFGAGTTLSGTNTAYGHHFYAGLEFSWQSIINTSAESPSRSKALKQFRESTEDGVDQSLFEDVDVSDELN